MIVGETQWIGQENDEQYDLFFKKIRKKIKKVATNPFLNPLGRGLGLAKKVIIQPKQKYTPAPQQKAIVQAYANKAVKEKQAQLNNDRQNLVQEMEAFEAKKVQEVTQLDEEKVKTEQEKIDVEQGENKRILYIGLAGLGVLIVVGGIIVFIKSKQNKLAALNHQ